MEATTPTQSPAALAAELRAPHKGRECPGMRFTGSLCFRCRCAEKLEDQASEAERLNIVTKHLSDRLTASEQAISSQSREIERLRAFAQGFIDRAPKEEPDRYEGDNHGDSETNACDRMSWHLAKAARAAIGGSS